MASSAESLPEHWLQAALDASSPRNRAKYASKGLSLPALEPDTQSLLLRQLYLAHMDCERYLEARQTARDMVELGELGDVALHDAARACLGLEEFEAAAQHLRVAARSAPASRRAFHLSCLGGLHYATGQYQEAIGVLHRAVRWATERSVLYQSQLELALAADGQKAALAASRECLESAHRLGRYGRFLLGEICFYLELAEPCHEHLSQFLSSVEDADASLKAGLRAEVLRSKAHLAQLDAARTAL